MTTDWPELSSYFELAEIDEDLLQRFADAAHTSFAARERFEALLHDYRQAAEGSRPDALKLALGWWILGRFADALAAFENAPASKLRHWYAADAAVHLGRLDVALNELRAASRQGADALETEMRMAVIHVRAGDVSAAEKLIEKHRAAGPDRAAWHFARGVVAEARDDRPGALEAFEKCVTLKPNHTEGLFRCARLYDLLGDDNAALVLYQRLAFQPRAHVNALLNAAVIYEDDGRYDEAIQCLRRVLRAFPNHTRARLFLKDVESCRHMVIDETGEETVDARARLLDTPMSEFELSVRARNCLKKMNIRTLGELIHLSEAELMAYKNFGETSLSEIKALLSKKGLHLGQRPEEIEVAWAPEPAAPPKPTLPPGQEAVLNKSVAEIELSVRARRCLQRLNIQTLADLVQYSEADLLATRNFGVTSLNEVKARLAEHNLQLAPRKQA